MSMVSKMKDTYNTKEVVFKDYTEKRKNQTESIISCFFEGDDDIKYYSGKLDLLIESKTEHYVCKGKRNVIALYKMIALNTKDKLEDVAFFVDNDYDDKTKLLKMYEPPCYSIENLYLSNCCIKKIIKNSFSISESNDLFENVETYIYSMRDVFIQNVLELCCIYSLQRNKTKLFEDYDKPDLSGIKSLNESKFIKFNKESIEKQYSYDEVKDKVERFIDCTTEEINNEKDKLEIDGIKFIRGKYCIEFLIKILNYAIDLINNEAKKDKSIKKVKACPNQGNILELYSSYADVPECLKEFCKNLNGTDCSSVI